MKSTIFREYDIRGIVGEELIIEDVTDLARTIAYYFMTATNVPIKKIAIGMDGRTHSPAIKEKLCTGLLEAGFELIFIGICPTPMLYFATYNYDFDAAIMVTASHNPPEYNGLKILIKTHSLWGDQIREIRELYQQKKYFIAEKVGTYSEQSIKKDYIAWHVDHFTHLKNMDLPAVIDCGNGAGGVVIPDIVKEMGWKNVQILYPEVDGTFPNHEADPTILKNMEDVRQKLKTTDAIVGIGLDGDADRMDAMTKEGELVGGDKLLALFVQPMVANYPAMTVVYNVVCSAGLTELLEKWGLQSVVTPVGHSIIEEKMHEYDALVGGETSCHFFFRDRHFGYDDGIYGMFRLLELLVQSKKTLTQLLTIFPKKYTSPEYRVACDEESKHALVKNVKSILHKQKHMQISSIDGVKAITDYGWGLIRASNTQPVLSIRFEANTPEDLQHIKEDFIIALSDFFDAAYLREQFQM